MCLANQLENLNRKMKELERHQAEYSATRNRYLIYRDQIARANAEGKSDFDRERYGVKRGKKEGKA